MTRTAITFPAGCPFTASVRACLRPHHYTQFIRCTDTVRRIAERHGFHEEYTYFPNDDIAVMVLTNDQYETYEVTFADEAP